MSEGMSAHDVAVAVAPETSTAIQKKSEPQSATRPRLRGLSYAEGSSALTPDGGDSPVQLEAAVDPPPLIDETQSPSVPGTETTPVESSESDTESTGGETTGGETTPVETTPVETTAETTGDQPPGDGPGEPAPSEEELVAETHAMTLEVLEDKIRELSGKNPRVFKRRRKAKAARSAKEILVYLKGWDAQTITAAWNNVKGECATQFQDLITAIGYKDAARLYPREARATLMAHGDLVGFAEGCHKQNPYAAMMAVTLMAEADRAAFIAAHPGFDAELSAVDRESLSADAFFGKEEHLRKQEEAFRKKQLEGQEQEAQDTEAAEETARTEAGQKLIGELQALFAEGKLVDLLIRIGTHGSESEARAAVRTLEGQGAIKALIAGLSFDEKWNAHPLHMRRLLALRSAEANLADAKALFPDIPRKPNKKGKTKGAHVRKSPLTSADAYAIFQFMKALPAAHRQQFQEAHPALWEEMNVHMNASMKDADDTNFVGAHGEDEAAVNGLLLQLDDPKFWLESPAHKLTGTLKLVLAAGHRATIAAKLQALSQGPELAQIFQDGARRAAVEGALGLVGDPSGIPAEGSPEERAAAWLGCLKLEQQITSEDDKPKLRVFKVIGAITHANQETRQEIRAEKKAWREAKRNGEEVGDKPDRDRPSLVKQALGRKGVKVENLAVDELEDMTTSKNGNEDFFGLDFADIDREGGSAEDEDRNRVDAEFDAGEGRLVFKAPTLELDAVRFPLGDLLIQTGPVSMTDLHLDVRWPTPGRPDQKQRVIAEAKLIDARGIMITGPGKLASIGHVGAQAINFLLEEEDVDYSDNPDASQILALVAKHNPARSLINGLMTGRIESSTQELATYLGGFPGGSQGGIQLSVGGVQVEGVQIGADTYVDKSSVSGLELTYDTRPSVHFEARVKQLAEMIEGAQTQLAALPEGGLSETDAHKKGRLEGDIARWSEERQQLTGAIPGWQQKEQLYQDIFELHRLLGADARQGASDERVTLMRERAASLGYRVPDGAGLGDILHLIHKDLSHHAGATLSIDNVNVQGVDTDGADVDEVNVDGIDISGQGDALASSLDMKTIKRLGGEGSQNKAGDYVASEVSADVGQIEVKGLTLSGGGPKAVALIKTRDRYFALRDLAERNALEKTQFDALHAQWQVVLADGRSYGEVAEKMASLWEAHGADIEKDKALLAEFKACEQALSGHPIAIEQIQISGIAIHSGTSEASATSLDGNQPVTSTEAHSKVTVGEIEMHNLSTGGINVGGATATGLSAEADVDLLSDPTGLMKPDAGTTKVGLGTVRATDVQAGGTTVDEVGAEGLSLQVTSGPEGSSVELGLDKVYARGVGVEQGKKTAEDKKRALLEEIARRREKGEPYADLQSQLAAIEEGLASYTQAYADRDRLLSQIGVIDGRIEAAKKRLAAAKSEAKVKKHVDAEQARLQDQARIQTIEDEIAALLGDKKALQEELAGPQKIIDAYETSLGLSGETSLENIHVKVSGLPNLEQVMKVATGDADADLSGSYALELGLGPLTIPAIDYASSRMRIALGGAVMPSLRADATVGVEKVAASEGKPASHRIKSVDVAALKIPEVSGSGLRLTMGVEGEQILIELPTVSLKGLSLEGVHLPGLDAAALKTAEGKFDVASISASMSASVGDSLKANGDLSLQGLHAEALSSGAVDFGLGDLTLDKLGFKKTDTQDKPGGGTLISRIIAVGGKASKLGKLSVDGSFDRNTNELTTTVGLGELTLTGVDYLGAGTRLGVGKAAMKGVKVTVGVKFKAGEVPDGESPVESLWLHKLHIDSLAGRDIRYSGKGNKRERFGDGSERVSAIEQSISLAAGTLYGIDVGRMRLDGGDPSLALSVASGRVQDLDIWMQKNGKQVLDANASARVDGVSVSLVDDDLKLGIESFSGDAEVELGEGDGATTLDVEGVSVANTKVAVTDMGTDHQATTASIDSVTAKQLDFGMGVKGSGINTAHGLAGASLQGITLTDQGGVTTIAIASGEGSLTANAKLVGKTSGNYDANDPRAQKNDQFVAPMYKVDYEISALDKLNGQTRLLYPNGETFLHLNIVNGVIKLDVSDNIRQMWSSWWKDIKGEDLSSWGFDMDAWGKRIQAIRDLDDNAFWTMLLKGVEFAFNKWGESLTGGWANIADSVVKMLNADPKTKLVEAQPLAFASFQDSLNDAMKKYVDQGIETVLDYGMLYDIGRGDYGRAASDAGLWLVEWFGETVGWDAADEWAEEKREDYSAAREAELRKIVANFVGYITGGGVDMKLGSKDGQLSATKTPLAGGATRPLLSSLLDIDVAGGGSLAGGISVSALGTLRQFHFADGGTEIDMAKLQFGADATGQGNVGFDEETSRFSQADVDLSAGTWIVFEGLRFKVDKKKDELPAGVSSVQDSYAQNGDRTTDHGPTSNGNTVRYDAGQYSEMMLDGQDPVGPDYTTTLKTGDKIKAGAIGIVSDDWAEQFKSQKIAAQNAEVFGKYAPKTKTAR